MTFQPKQSGNPGGRPKAAAEMARLIREATREGADLVAFALQVWSGKIAEMNTEKSRQWAHDWLSDRGFGKPLQSVDMLDTSAIAPEQAAMLEALHMTPHERRAKLAEMRAKAIAVAADDMQDRAGVDE